MKFYHTEAGTAGLYTDDIILARNSKLAALLKVTREDAVLLCDNEWCEANPQKAAEILGIAYEPVHTDHC